MTPFNFSITDTLRDAWHLFKKHLTFFIGMAVISIILGYGSNHLPWILQIVVGIISYLWGIIWLKVSLAAARGEEYQLSFGSIQGMIPSFRQALTLIGVSILSGLIVLVGLIALIIPGLYFIFRVAFATLVCIDRNTGIRASVKTSWHITKGHYWKIVAAVLVAGLLYLCGAVLFGVGLLVAYPLASILMARLYLALIKGQEAGETVVPQSAEIPAHIEEQK